MNPRVLIVDDHLELAETLADGLAERGYDASPCADGGEAARRLETEPFDALVTDLRMPDVDGLGLLMRSRASAPGRPVIVMTAYGAVETAVQAIQQGAYHYLTKPFRLEELAVFLGRALDDARVRREARSLRAALRDEFRLDKLVAASHAMREVFDVAARVADAATPVLICGETGTGKTALARAIHATSERAAAPFVAVNCAAIPEALLESELFGHVKGAFTGATTARGGLFAEADGGTLLLDEVGEMSPALQAKLLHVLETGDVRAVGASKTRHVDVRILTATHRDLRERATSGGFREDLLYRLDVVSIEIPPLRRRPEDIPLLVARLLGELRSKHPRSVVERFSGDAMAKLLAHPWPGNVRELAHAIERVVLFARAAEASPADLPPTLTNAPAAPVPSAPVPSARLPADLASDAVLPIREVQRRYAVWALEKFDGHKARTAEALGIDGKTLAKWLGVDVDSKT